MRILPSSSDPMRSAIVCVETDPAKIILEAARWSESEVGDDA